MDAVSLETPQENEFIKQRISRGIENIIILNNLAYMFI
jgi:hypothetical protein